MKYILLMALMEETSIVSCPTPEPAKGKAPCACHAGCSPNWLPGPASERV